MIEKRPSGIHGFGNFATRPIQFGTLIINWMENSKVITASEVDWSRMTVIRLVGDLYIDGDTEDTDFINHSDNPNCIFFMGMVFAKTNINRGDEITLDYSTLFPPEHTDVVKGRESSASFRMEAEWMCDNVFDIRM